MKRFAGTGGLLRLIFRRDRIRLPVWIVSVSAFTAGFLPVYDRFLMKGTDPDVFATMMENPAMVALAGPVYGRADYHIGAAYGNMMLVFCVMLAALMNIYLVARHTRADEETGRAELLRAQPVGRAANLSSVLLAAVIANSLLALAVTGLLQLLGGKGVSVEGNWLFGAALGVTGLFFAGLTAVLAQVPENTRTLTTSALLLMLGMYLVRGAGDLYSETLSRLSPLGLILRVQLYVQNEWWPVWILLAASGVLAAASFALAGRRDLGAGLLGARPGRRHASQLLGSPLGLSLRLLRNSAVVWVIVVFSVAAMYGSVFGEMERFIESSEMLRRIFASDPAFTPLEQFVSLLNALMAMLTAIPVMGMVQRLAVEEESGRSDHLLGRAVSRTGNFTAWLLPALVLSLLLQGLVALGFWSVGSYVSEQTPGFTTFLLSAASFLPPVWLMAGIGAFLAGAFPKKRMLSYLYLGFSFVLVYIGSVAEFPEWVQKLSPFGHVSKYPVEEFRFLPLLLMIALTAGLVAFAIAAYRRRDLQNL